MPILFQALDAPLANECRHGAISIGNFDGVHLGHQALLIETMKQAHACAGPAVAVTFQPHPQQLLRPDAFQPTLTTVAHRAELLENHGADYVVVLHVTPAFLQLGAREFFERIVRDRLAARAVIEGFNFGFGRKREGTTDLLKALGQESGVGVTLVKARELDGKPVSTSRVRAELTAGHVAGARQLMGRPYRLIGRVGSGQKRGQTLGFPTANLHDVSTLVPGTGVYAVRVLHGGSTWPGAANIGPNPTFGEEASKIEVHLIGFQGDLYDTTLMVDFYERIRATRTFSSPTELIEQLRRDVEQAKTLLGS